MIRFLNQILVMLGKTVSYKILKTSLCCVEQTVSDVVCYISEIGISWSRYSCNN